MATREWPRYRAVRTGTMWEVQDRWEGKQVGQFTGANGGAKGARAKASIMNNEEYISSVHRSVGAPDEED